MNIILRKKSPLNFPNISYSSGHKYGKNRKSGTKYSLIQKDMNKGNNIEIFSKYKLYIEEGEINLKWKLEFEVEKFCNKYDSNNKGFVPENNSIFTRYIGINLKVKAKESNLKNHSVDTDKSFKNSSCPNNTYSYQK